MIKQNANTKSKQRKLKMCELDAQKYWFKHWAHNTPSFCC